MTLMSLTVDSKWPRKELENLKDESIKYSKLKCKGEKRKEWIRRTEHPR